MIKGARSWSGVLLITSLAVVPMPGRRVREGGTQMVATVDETAIRKVVRDEVAAWNWGDATANSSQFANDGTCTSIRGQFFTGHGAFPKQHEVIFQGIFKNTTLQQDIVSLKFIRPDVAIVETLTSLGGMPGTAPGTAANSKGRLRTRLLQVVARQGGEWKIVAYHNVDVKPGVPVPEPM
jgi:uncharacterized protein (TIGR02246 family)